MKWSNRLMERTDKSCYTPLVWWVKQSEADKEIKRLKKVIKDLEAKEKGIQI